MSSSSLVPPPPIPANSAPPGIILPQVKPFTVGTSSPGQSALVAGQNQAETQTKMINALQGGRKKKWMGGASSSQYNVAQFHQIYPCMGGPSQCPNSIIQSTTGTSGQSYANRVYDNLVGQKAGTKICSSGQTNCWGCYSGGSKKSSKKGKKAKNSKKRSISIHKKSKTSKKRKSHKK